MLYSRLLYLHISAWTSNLLDPYIIMQYRFVYRHIPCGRNCVCITIYRYFSLQLARYYYSLLNNIKIIINAQSKMFEFN